jgi:DNA-binding beta-propeller fold protein YncE
MRPRSDSSFPRICRYLAATVLLLVPRLSRAQIVTDTIAVGINPTAVAVNEVTNRIYVANCTYSAQTYLTQGTVTVIDGETNLTTKIPVGVCPGALAVNPLTNKVYVANFGRYNQFCSSCSDYGSVTVIDGATDAATTIVNPSGKLPRAVAVNPVTNTIYVTNNLSGNITAISGDTGSFKTIALPGTNPYDVAVNPLTNKIYVTSFRVNVHKTTTVLVIDGVTNAVDVVNDASASQPLAVAVNPTTNMIYVANHVSNANGGMPAGNTTVIDGVTESVFSVVDTSVYGSHSLVVNPETNQIYVAGSGSPALNFGGGVVTVIDGETNSFRTVVDPTASSTSVTRNIAVDVATNRVYVANDLSNTVTAIDGVTHAIVDLTDANAETPRAVAVNSVTGKIYVANASSNNVTVIDGLKPAVPMPRRCTTVRPGADWTCVNGNWLPPGFPLPGGGTTGGSTGGSTGGTTGGSTGTGTCTTVRPGADWTCVSGNWLPPGFPTGGTASGGGGTATGGTTGGGAGSATCTTVRPGADWTCVNGNWLPPGFPISGGGTTGSTGGTGTTTCTTIKPAVDWVCAGGNWLPPGHPLLMAH